jgi:hypothetical protein
LTLPRISFKKNSIMATYFGLISYMWPLYPHILARDLLYVAFMPTYIGSGFIICGSDAHIYWLNLLYVGLKAHIYWLNLLYVGLKAPFVRRHRPILRMGCKNQF